MNISKAAADKCKLISLYEQKITLLPMILNDGTFYVVVKAQTLFYPGDEMSG